MTKIRFLKASSFSSLIANDLYLTNPDLKNESYDDQYKACIQTRYTWSDFWKKHLENTGHFEVQEILSNVEPLQKRWAYECGVKFNPNNWISEIVAAQVLKFRPHIFFPHDYGNLHADMIKTLKIAIPKLKILCYDGIALNDPSRFKECDIMLSCVDFVVDYYKNQGLNASLFRPAFETSLLDNIRQGKLLYPITFVGGISLGPTAHNNRFDVISHLNRSIPVELWGILPSYKKYIISRLVYLKKRKFSKVFLSPLKQVPDLIKLHQKNHGAIFGYDMYQTLANSKITINSHIDAAGSQAGNMRLYEATGVGTCLVTDWKENLSDIFEIDYEVVAYRNPEECVEKVKYLLENEDTRKQIAEKGQKKTLIKYSFKNQVEPIAELLLNMV